MPIYFADSSPMFTYGLGIRYIGSFMSMQLGLGPLTTGSTIGGGEGRTNTYALSWNWDEGGLIDGRQEMIIATTSNGSSSAGRFPVWLSRGQTFGAYEVAGAWAIDNLTMRSTSATRYRPIGTPPNITGLQPGYLRITQTGSNLIGDTSPDGITYANWFTEPLNLAEHVIVGANHGIYVEASDDGNVSRPDSQVIFYSYKHTASGGATEVEWIADTEIPWAIAGPGIDWSTNGAWGNEFAFPSANVAFWDAINGVVTLQ